MHKGLIRIAAVLGPALAVLVLGSSVADAQEKRTSRIKGAQEVVPEEESYTFLARQGALLFDYGKFHQATESFVQACGTEEGALDPDCWRRLGTVATRAGQIGIAIEAWATVLPMDPARAQVAKTELDRLQSSFGRVQVVLPPERDLPSQPVKVGFEGLIIDPSIKSHLKSVLQEVEAKGFTRDELWLPLGTYTAESASVTVEQNKTADWILPGSLIPYRPKAFGLVDRPTAAPVGGPWELSVAMELGSGGTPDGSVGSLPITVGGQVRLGRHIGPIRVEGRLRVGATPSASLSDDPEGLRSATSGQVLGQLDLGIDMALSSKAYLTPHIGFVGGSMGNLLVGCIAENEATEVVYLGECRLAGIGLGAQAGADLWWVLGAGRATLRMGLAGETLGGVVPIAAGRALKGETDTQLVRVEASRFVWVRGLFDIGVSVRF
ncbi:MAG: hypothetical protein CL928_15485 [Deltaproteobacteria bacterium]|nr:hypothetical protein [Deltaproteobacteria bacterium]